jgi:hypothetical protein
VLVAGALELLELLVDELGFELPLATYPYGQGR